MFWEVALDQEKDLIYLDNSSTTRQADEVTELIAEVSKEHFGNPSSLHRLGLDAEKIVEKARESFASLLGVRPEDCFFNSGGTEGDNDILLDIAEKRKHDGNRIVISEVEHPAVMETVKRLEKRGFDVVNAPVGSDGVVDMDALKELVTDGTILVSVMTVNNETGAVMPVKEISEYAHSKGALVHTDAVQALGKMDMREVASSVDAVTVSSHKIHGPKGVGGVYVKSDIRKPALITGGGQEKDRRSGTENVPGIAGFGKACELAGEAREKAFDHVKKLSDMLRKGIEESIGDVEFNGPEAGDPAGLPYVLNVSFLGTRGEVILHTLEQDGIYVSTGSACSSNRNEKSYVLGAMGRSSKEIEGAVRFSFSRYNTEDEVEETVERVKAAVERFRSLGSFR